MEEDTLYRYKPTPSKSYCVCKHKDKIEERAEFEKLGLTINYGRGSNYLGGFVGSHNTKAEWLGKKVASLTVVCVCVFVCVCLCVCVCVCV